MKNTKIPFGAKVQVFQKYTRTQSWGKRGYKIDLITKTGGVFLGFRTLSSGRIQINDYEPALWIPEIYIRAVLVCLNERTNPIYVPLTGLRLIKEN